MQNHGVGLATLDRKNPIRYGNPSSNSYHGEPATLYVTGRFESTREEEEEDDEILL